MASDSYRFSEYAIAPPEYSDAISLATHPYLLDTRNNRTFFLHSLSKVTFDLQPWNLRSTQNQQSSPLIGSIRVWGRPDVCVH